LNANLISVEIIFRDDINRML